MKISRNQLFPILGERQPVTPDTAVRLAADMGGSPRSMPLVKRSQFHWVGRSLLNPHLMANGNSWTDGRHSLSTSPYGL